MVTVASPLIHSILYWHDAPKESPLHKQSLSYRWKLCLLLIYSKKNKTVRRTTAVLHHIKSVKLRFSISSQLPSLNEEASENLEAVTDSARKTFAVLSGSIAVFSFYLSRRLRYRFAEKMAVLFSCRLEYILMNLESNGFLLLFSMIMWIVSST